MPRGMRRGGPGRAPGPVRPPGRRRRIRRRRVMIAGGLIAVGAYHLTSRDADRIEEHTGAPPEDLSDDELEQSMRDLNIEGQPSDQGTSA